MKLFLKNIGKISFASVEINGITVIAGENNTGKSTVGRALFSMFNSFYDVPNKVKRERISSIRQALDRMYEESGTNVYVAANTLAIAKAVASYEFDGNDSGESLRQALLTLLDLYNDGTQSAINDEVLDRTVRRINDISNISDEAFLFYTLSKNFAAEFNGQVRNIFNNNVAEIKLLIQDKPISFSVMKDGSFSMHKGYDTSLYTDAIYIDDPFVLDDYPAYPSALLSRNHRNHLRNKLFSIRKPENVLDEIIVEQKFSLIHQKISSICDGDIIRKGAQMVYQKPNSGKTLNVRNLSTGLKTFVILKTLLLNGAIKEDGVIILDEPEIHLHPEWQLLFAELIVLIQKEFGVYILLNTHSPYFLRAIQVYSMKYGTAEACKYYLSEVVNDNAEIIDTTGDIDMIYKKLYHPLQKLEDERWQE